MFGLVLVDLGNGSKKRDFALDWKLRGGRGNPIIWYFNKYYLEGLKLKL